MLLTLYDKRNNQKMEIAPSDSSACSKAVQSDNVLSLSFVSYECETLEVNDYIDFCGERFWATDRYTPKQKSTVEWEYDIKLYGIESLIKRYLVVKLVNGDNETEFSYTATAYDHVTLIVQNINAGMETSDWKVGEVVTSEYLTIDYEGTYCDEGFKKVADLTGVEYWIEGTTVNVSRCEHSERITLGYDKGLTSLYSDKADNVKFFTRLFPIGSTRNIAYDTYGHSRLKLPGGVKYIDQDTDKFGVVHHYEKEAFAHIYPRRIGTISQVRTQEVKGEDGKPFTIYYFKDSSLNFNPNDYQMNGLVKMVSFQDNSSLAGRDFEVNYNDKTKEFEIITQWPYDNDTQLPNEQLAPKVLDEYILWNIKMPTEYYALAETEFKKAVEEFMERQYIDVSVYKAHTDYIDIAERGLNLTIGRRVRLEHPDYFAGGYRDSRITKITRKVVRPTDMDIEISDVLSKGALEKVDDTIADLSHYTKVATGGFPDVIKSWESTLPTDSTVFSSRKVDKHFLSNRRPERTPYPLSSDMHFDVGQFLSGGMTGTGGRFGIDPNGRSFVEVDYLYARFKAFFDTVEINRIQANVGNQTASAAGIKCSYVEQTEQYYRCYFTTQDDTVAVKNTFVVGDLAYCLETNVRLTDDTKFRNRFYWRAVVGIGDNYIDLSKSDQSTDTTDTPRAGDNIVQRGNVNDPTRQNIIEERTVGTNTPSYTLCQGVDSYSMEGKAVISLGFNSVTNRAEMKVYGDTYIGRRDGTSFLKYDSTTGEMEFKGKASFASGSSGLTNLEEWNEAERGIQDAQDSANEAKDMVNRLPYVGRNLLLNTRDYADLKHWEVFRWELQAEQERADVQNGIWQGYEPAIQLYSKNISTGAFSVFQYFNTTPGKEYILSGYIAGHRSSKRIIVRHDGGEVAANVVYQTHILGGEGLNNWEKINIPFLATKDRAYVVLEMNAINDAECYIWFKHLKVELGDRSTEWSPAYEDTEEGIAQAKQVGETAQQEVLGLNQYVDGAFRDGVIDSAEAVAIEKYINQVNDSFAQLDSIFSTLYNNPILIDNQIKTQLYDSHITLIGSKSALLSTINNAIADGKTNEEEKQLVDSAYLTYRQAAERYQASVEQVNLHITNVLAFVAEFAFEKAGEADDKASSASAAAGAAQSAISAMNDDTVFDMVEKQTIRTQWEKISGVASTSSNHGTNGSYFKALTEISKIESLNSHRKSLTVAYNSLRSYLNTNELYISGNKLNFNRAQMAVFFTLYGNVEVACYNAMQEYYTSIAQQTANTANKELLKLEFLKEAYSEETTIQGGVVQNSVTLLKDKEGRITCLINGDPGRFDAVAFAAGIAGFLTPGETRNLQIFHNGRLVARDADIEGRVNATSGSFTGSINASSGLIGGFEIAPGRIGVENSDGRQGLSILNSFIKFSDEQSWTGIGIDVLPSISGWKGLARFEINGLSQWDAAAAISVNVPASIDYSSVVRRAYNGNGNFWSMGGHCLFDTTYQGAAWNNTIMDNIHHTHRFVFTSIPSAHQIVTLPGHDIINRIVGNRSVSFTLEIQIAVHIPNKIRIVGTASGWLVGNTGLPVNGDFGWIDMYHSNSIILKYYASHYFMHKYP